MSVGFPTLHKEIAAHSPANKRESHLFKCRSEDVRTAFAGPVILHSGNSEERRSAYAF
jgi:hypothetical protein